MCELVKLSYTSSLPSWFLWESNARNGEQIARSCTQTCQLHLCHVMVSRRGEDDFFSKEHYLFSSKHALLCICLKEQWVLKSLTQGQRQRKRGAQLPPPAKTVVFVSFPFPGPLYSSSRWQACCLPPPSATCFSYVNGSSKAIVKHATAIWRCGISLIHIFDGKQLTLIATKIVNA